MDHKNFYEILGIDKSADFQEIKSAYYEKIKIWHPDKNPSNLEKAEEMSKCLNEAYHVLSDSERRRQYDTMLKFTEGKDFDEINDNSFQKAFNRVGRLFKGLQDNVHLMYRMFKDSISGNYKLDSVTFAVIAVALLYFILPIDLVADYIPVAGYIDDAAIISMISGTLTSELNKYNEQNNIKK